MILNFSLEHPVDIIFVDDAGAGGAVVDHLMRHNLPVEGVAFGGKSIGDISRVKYANKRAEMWGNLKDRLPYLALPNSADLRDQLIGPEFKFKSQGRNPVRKKGGHPKARLGFAGYRRCVGADIRATGLPEAVRRHGARQCG
jgi:hypothetical protein